MKASEAEKLWDKERWPNFRPSELACKCCGEIWKGEQDSLPERLVKFLDALQELRMLYGRPVIISSGHRCTRHNAEVGGVESSQHLAIAADIRCPAEEQARFGDIAAQAGFTGIGFYRMRGFVHVDLGPRRTWRG